MIIDRLTVITGSFNFTKAAEEGVNDAEEGYGHSPFSVDYHVNM